MKKYTRVSSKKYNPENVLRPSSSAARFKIKKEKAILSVAFSFYLLLT
jgi:hypothetical protein